LIDPVPPEKTAVKVACWRLSTNEAVKTAVSDGFAPAAMLVAAAPLVTAPTWSTVPAPLPKTPVSEALKLLIAPDRARPAAPAPCLPRASRAQRAGP
jgi:hypothetical protein